MKTNPKPHTFILFPLLKSDEQYGVHLPNAVLVRMSESLKERLMSTALDVEADFFRRVEINVSSDDVRWLSVVAFDSENKLSAVGATANSDAWYDPQVDKLIYAADSENMEEVEFGEDCSIFSQEGIPSSFLTLEKYSGKILLGAGGETNSHWNLVALSEEWVHVSPLLDEDVVPSKVHRPQG